MQNRYAGDIGDYVKLALLRALSSGKNLGIAWYLYPDESHNEDGKHTSYLGNPGKWRHLDAKLFDTLGRLTQTGRSVRGIEQSGVLTARYFSNPLSTASLLASQRCTARSRWFSSALDALSGCDLVFADPDNGLVDDAPERRRDRLFGKRLPLSEVWALAAGRTAIIYHHNTRFRGGHTAEVDHWIKRLGPAIAVRATAYSCRTFFILNPDASVQQAAEAFAARWRNHGVRLHERG